MLLQAMRVDGITAEGRGGKERGGEPPIQRPREAMTVALPVISFEVDLGAAQQRVDNGQEK